MQHLTFCGVGVHHQNGIAEAKTKQLTLPSRTMLLHAQRLWPEYILAMLWSFALLAVADCMNNMHVDSNWLTPEMKFPKLLLLQCDFKIITPLAVRSTYWMLGCRMQGELDRPNGIPALA